MEVEDIPLFFTLTPVLALLSISDRENRLIHVGTEGPLHCLRDNSDLLGLMVSAGVCDELRGEVTMPDGRTMKCASERLEDPLAYLPFSPIVRYKKRQTIYEQDQPLTSMFLVIDGSVKCTRIANGGRQTLIDIYRADEFFGEAALLGLPYMPEQATALADTSLMSWTVAEIDLITRQKPRLSTGLMQIMVERSLEYRERLESFTIDDLGCRLAYALIHLSMKLGVSESDGFYRVTHLTHGLLAQYVGASRETVTNRMNVFRRQGLVRYSRTDILLFRDAVVEWLRMARVA